jgi:hypothetical protein
MMADIQSRIDSTYRSDVIGSVTLVALLWVAILFVLIMTWPVIPDASIRMVVLVAAAAVLVFNTAAIIAMIRHYREDKTFIYTLDIENYDAHRNRSM